MRHLLLLALPVLPLRTWMGRWLALQNNPPRSFDALLAVWREQVDSQRQVFDTEVALLRDFLLASRPAERKGVSDALFLYLDPQVKFRGVSLCERHGWPDLGRRSEDGYAFSPDLKLEVVDQIHLGSIGKLSREEWKLVRDFAGRCSFATYLFCVVRSSRIDLLRRIYGTAGRRAFQSARSLGRAGIELYRMVHGVGMTPEKARHELLHTCNIELSAQEVARMLDLIGETGRHKVDADCRLVYSRDDEGRVTGVDQVDPAPLAEELLAEESPLPGDVIERIRLNGTQRYLLKLRYGGPDSKPRSAQEISKIMGKGYSPETVRTMLQEILERVRGALGASLPAVSPGAA